MSRRKLPKKYIGRPLSEIEKEQICTACSGSGYYDVKGSPKCGQCGGTGVSKEMNFDLDQLKRDNGRCLYYNAPAFAVQLPSGILVLERPDGSYRNFVNIDDPHLRNLPRKTLVQVWEHEDGRRCPFLGSDNGLEACGWTLIAQREIKDGEGL